MTVSPQILEMISNPTAGRLGDLGQTYLKSKQVGIENRRNAEKDAQAKTEFQQEQMIVGSKVVNAYANSALDWKSKNQNSSDEEFADYQLTTWNSLDDAQKELVPQGFQTVKQLNKGKEQSENILRAFEPENWKVEQKKVPTTRKVGEMVNGEAYIVDQEYDPSTEKWKEVGRKKGADGRVTYIGQREDQKFTYLELAKATDDARYAIKEKQNIGYIREAMDGIKTGALTDIKVSLGKLAASLELPVPDDIRDLESANTAMGNLVMAGLNNFPGQISNEERTFVAGIMPKLTQTMEGREQIMEFLDRLSGRRIEYRRQMTKFIGKNKSLITDKTSFYDEWDKYELENPVTKGLDLLNADKNEEDIKYVEIRNLPDGRKMGKKEDGTIEFIEK